jgi:hypothetical protein
VRIGKPGAWQIIQPGTEWKTMPSPAPKDDLQVATDLYYVAVNKL